MVIREDCARLERRLRELCNSVFHAYTKAKGRKKSAILHAETRVFVLEGETVSANTQTLQTESNHPSTKDELHVVRQTCSELLQDMAEAIASYEEQIEQLQKKVADAENRACTSQDVNKGKKITEVSPRQARRKVSQLRKTAEKALWFANTFGLIPRSLLLEKDMTGSPVKLDFNPSSHLDACEDKVDGKIFEVSLQFHDNIYYGWDTNHMKYDGVIYSICGVKYLSRFRVYVYRREVHVL